MSLLLIEMTVCNDADEFGVLSHRFTGISFPKYLVTLDLLDLWTCPSLGGITRGWFVDEFDFGECICFCRALQPTMTLPWSSCLESIPRAHGIMTPALRLSLLDSPLYLHP